VIPAFTSRRTRALNWQAPLAVANGLKDRDGALALLSDGGVLGRWSYVAADPDAVETIALNDSGRLDLLRQPLWVTSVVGLLSYDAGARPATGPRPNVWPDLMLARYPSILVFDHHSRTVEALGHGEDDDSAELACAAAAAWLDQAPEPSTQPAAPPPPATDFTPEASPDVYCDAVADVVTRIGSGELFQANIARAWTGGLKPDADPFDVLLRLAGREAAFGAFWRLGDRAVVSNSPELFLAFDRATGRIETRPIKGTRPRGATPAEDAALIEDLQTSAKDRAENLMIVDLMRNDLARAARPGSVVVERLFAVESHARVHHLVSTVSGFAEDGVETADLLETTFPPGSITGAPKHQAMKVIAMHEPPRGPWCGSLFHIQDERMTASVLIRTASFEHSEGRWRFRALAGAGIVADSDPVLELAETDAKIASLREALIGQQLVQVTTSAERGRR
jgi:para-aminobenzoate synthetase component 1